MVKDDEKLTWSSYGVDAAQLFRDFFFEKYPMDISPGLVHSDPDRPYRFYQKTSFYTHVKTTKKKVETYKTFQTGINNEAFKKKLRLGEEPDDIERGSKLKNKAKPATKAKKGKKKAASIRVDLDEDEDEENDEEDESFRPGKEEDDITLAGFEIESFLGNLKIRDSDENEEDINSIVGKNARMVYVRGFTNNELGVKYLAELPDGRLSFVCAVPSGWEGNFVVSDCQQEVLMKWEVPKFMTKGREIFSVTGMNNYYGHVMAVQAEIDKLLEKDAENIPATEEGDEDIVQSKWRS